VIELVMRGLTAEHKWRTVDVPGLVHPSHVSTPRFFISHTWSSNLCELIGSVASALSGLVAERTYCWVDMFAVNQWDFKDDLGNLKNAIKASEGGTLVVLGSNDPRGGPLTRIWWAEPWRLP
jgi:hypothetical protein